MFVSNVQGKQPEPIGHYYNESLMLFLKLLQEDVFHHTLFLLLYRAYQLKEISQHLHNGDLASFRNTGEVIYSSFITSVLRYEDCYGLLHIPRSLGPTESFAGDSIDHFVEGIDTIINLTTQLGSTFKSFTPTEQTRAGLAAYDAGVSAIRGKRK